MLLVETISKNRRWYFQEGRPIKQICRDLGVSRKTVRTHKTALVVACTLGSGDFEDRVADIRDLYTRLLLSSHREPLALHLTYAAAALAEVEQLVAEEAECCAFLDFNLQAGETVQLTITAPEKAASAADELFSHFAQELARTAV